MNRLQYLLTKLAEEATEIGQIALKTQQFSLDEICPNLPYSNKERCHQEVNDLLAIVEMLNREFNFGYIPDDGEIAAKINKVNKYYNYSIDCGMVQEEIKHELK